MGAISGDLEKIWNKKQFLLPLIYRLGGRGGAGFLLQERSTYVIPSYSVVLIPPH